MSADFSTDLSLERLQPAASAMALEAQSSRSDAEAKPRRRPRSPRPGSDGDAAPDSIHADSTTDPDEATTHRIDSLA
jgi:hypothetical protein